MRVDPRRIGPCVSARCHAERVCMSGVARSGNMPTGGASMGVAKLSLASRRWALVLHACPGRALRAGRWRRRVAGHSLLAIGTVLQHPGPDRRPGGDSLSPPSYEDQCTDNAEPPTVEGTAIIQSAPGVLIVHLGLSTINGRLIGVIENLSTLNGLWNDSYGHGQLIASQGVSRSSPFPRRPRGNASFVHSSSPPTGPATSRASAIRRRTAIRKR